MIATQNGIRRWHVVSPEYWTIDVIDFEIGGPKEYGCDVVEVEASTRREAIIKGVHLMRNTIRKGWHNYFASNENPFKGMKAYPIEEDIGDG